jgi:hypothetical protein
MHIGSYAQNSGTALEERVISGGLVKRHSPFFMLGSAWDEFLAGHDWGEPHNICDHKY